MATLLLSLSCVTCTGMARLESLLREACCRVPRPGRLSRSHKMGHWSTQYSSEAVAAPMGICSPDMLKAGNGVPAKKLLLLHLGCFPKSETGKDAADSLGTICARCVRGLGLRMRRLERRCILQSYGRGHTSVSSLGFLAPRISMKRERSCDVDSASSKDGRKLSSFLRPSCVRPRSGDDAGLPGANTSRDVGL